LSWGTRRRSRGRGLVAVAVAVAAAVMSSFASAAFAETYGTPGNEAVVGINGSNANGQYLALSDSGSASAPFGVGASLLGPATGTVGVSAFGPAYGTVALSAFGTANGSAVGASGTEAASSSLVAVSGTGAANGWTAAVSGTEDASGGPGGVAVSGLGAAEGGAAGVDGTLNWIDTPEGPIAVGAGVKSLVQYVEAMVADVAGEVEAQGRVVSTNVQSYLDEATAIVDDHVQWANNRDERLNDEVGYLTREGTEYDPVFGAVTLLRPPLLSTSVIGSSSNQGGCPAGTSCSNMRIVGIYRLPWKHDEGCCTMFDGMSVYTWTEPSYDPGGGYKLDFFHAETTLTGHGAGICGIQHDVTGMGTDELGYWSMEPFGETNVSDGSTRNVNYGLNAYGFTGSMGYSHPVWVGKVQGKNNGGNYAAGVWTTKKNTCPAYNGGSASFRSSNSWAWPHYAADSRYYGGRVTIWYQNLTY